MINNTDAELIKKNSMDIVPRPRIKDLIFPFWTSRQSLSAWLVAALIATLIIGTSPIYIYANKLAGNVTDGLVNRQWDALLTAIMLSVVVGVFSGVLTYAQSTLASVLELKWRTWLTHRLLQRWIDGHAFADIERDHLISNADQRIAEDARLFVEKTLNLVISSLGVIVGTITYTFLLWQLSQVLRFSYAGIDFAIHGYMVYVAVAYCVFSLVITHWVGKQMIGLSMHRQGAEADFRFRATQVRENAEQIAFYQGGDEELKSLRLRFESVRTNFKAIIIRNFKIGLATTTYGKFFDPLPTVAALPLYFSGQITLGGITMLSGAYSALVSSLSFFSQAYVGFAEWMAVGNRLRDLLWAIEKAGSRKQGFEVVRSDGNDLNTSALTLSSPMGEPLTHIPALHIQPGDRVIVRGPSGAGKSTLLRTIAGLWPYGHGSISTPRCGAMYVPQRSYIPAGSIKNALCYPAAHSAFDDTQCRKALLDCGLDARLPSLTEVDHWQQVLSGGEQQRLALARILLHRPKFVFLDEATSALDPTTEQIIYARLIECLPHSAIVSIAHRDSLLHFHNRVLDLVPALYTDTAVTT